jgi:hypothetical protein
MKWIKKFENFDTPELRDEVKDSDLISYLTGDYLNVPFRKVKSGEFDDNLIIQKILYKYPHFDDFYVDDKVTPGMIHLFKKNKDWYVNFCVGKGAIGIYYKYNKADENKVLRGLDFRGFQFPHFQEWSGLSDEEIYKIIDYYLLPILLKCGFRDELEQGRKKIQIREN